MFSFFFFSYVTQNWEIGICVVIISDFLFSNVQTLPYKLYF